MKILVVDDEPSVREFLGAALRFRKHHVECEESGEDALRRIMDIEPDVVLLDLVMPGIDGIETAQRMRDDGYAGPILLFSGFLTAEVSARAHAMGLLPISKVDTEALFRVIAALAGEITAFKPAVLGAQ